MTYPCISQLFNIRYPIIQGGMVWNSGYRLASAVSNAGGLGLIGAGSMYPDVLREHIRKCKAATDRPFGVNIPLFYPDLEDIIEIILSEKVKIIFTSAGNPLMYTKLFQKEGCKVAHVVSSTKFALKCQSAGVDAVVAEGFEAGGHNGREETTTFCLIPAVRQAMDSSIPLIAAGGVTTGAQMKAAFVLGAQGVQIGSRFAATHESSGHQAYKQAMVNAGEGDTGLTLKEIAPVRLQKNKFYQEIQEMYQNGASLEELKTHLGRGRAKKGMLEGNTFDGELEFGQGSSLITSILSVQEVMDGLVSGFNNTDIPMHKI